MFDLIGKKALVTGSSQGIGKELAKALADAEFRAKVVASIPAGYVGDPKDINGVTLLLCSDEGRYITGTDIVVDGGMRL